MQLPVTIQAHYLHTALHHHVHGDVKSSCKFVACLICVFLFFVKLRQPL